MAEKKVQEFRFDGAALSVLNLTVLSFNFKEVQLRVGIVWLTTQHKSQSNARRVLE